MIQPTHNKKGFALLLSLIISTVVLAIGLSILEISINQINLSSTSRESELAFQAAHAGVDCMWYWRFELADGFTEEDANVGFPNFTCFGESPIASTKTRVQSTASGYVDLFSTTLQWGNPTRCTDINMYVLNAVSGDLSLTFTNEAVGTNGIKECNEGNTCTVLVSGGYNRACDELSGNIFTVQREITVEF